MRPRSGIGRSATEPTGVVYRSMREAEAAVAAKNARLAIKQATDPEGRTLPPRKEEQDEPQ